MRVSTSLKLGIRENLARHINRKIWPYYIGNRGHAMPDGPDWSEFRRNTIDDVSIYGACLSAGAGASGTLVFVHGFTAFGLKWQEDAWRLRDRLGVNVLLPDLRHHGHSGDAPPTFGTAESWDLRACLDWAQEQNLPGPYWLMGESLGGMAAQRLLVDDERVSAAVCVQTPGWPWDAVGKNMAWNADRVVVRVPKPIRWALWGLRNSAVGAGLLINWAYGFDILTDGDVRRHTQNPPGNPYILYVHGTDDAYEPSKSLEVWKHFYPDEPAAEEVGPDQAPQQRKWFVTVPGHSHWPPGPTVFEWPGFWPLIEKFFEVVRQRGA